MRAYVEYEYEDYDDYADEDEEQLKDAEVKQEEDPCPTKETLEYLELRKKIKEALLKKMKKEGHSASQDKRRTSYDKNFNPRRSCSSFSPFIFERAIEYNGLVA